MKAGYATDLRAELEALATSDHEDAATTEELRVLIKQALVRARLSQKALAAQAGMTEQVLSHFLNGRRKQLRREELQRIAEVLGQAEDRAAAATSHRPPARTRLAVELPPRRLLRIPVYPIGAGYEIAFGDGDVPLGESLEDPVYASDISDPNAFAGKVVGSSMDGGSGRERFREGDIVIFDTKAEVRSGAFCLVRLDNGSATFKQVFLEAGRVRLHALNPDIPDAVHPREGIRTMYRAVRHTRSL